MVLDPHAEGIQGCVHHNRDDSYTIFINAKLSYEEQKEIFYHELGHILGNDFSKDDIQKIEYDAHNRIYDYEFSEEICPVF